MPTVTIDKKKYTELLEKELRYDYLRQAMEEDIFASPPERNRKKVLTELKSTGKYNKQFLDSMKRGLKRSSYFKE
ncbi:MAG: hypothetical protein AAB710_00235 [Patescibacteria group bacterium]